MARVSENIEVYFDFDFSFSSIVSLSWVLLETFARLMMMFGWELAGYPCTAREEMINDT
jgi:hypothetical protein